MDRSNEIKDIINEINNEKRKINEFKNDFVNDDKCIKLILSLFKNFFSSDINDGIYVVIFNNFDIYKILVDMLFINNDIVLNLEINDNYRIINELENDRIIFYSDGVCNYINLDNKIMLEFSNNILNIRYKSDLDVCENDIYLLDEDGIVIERRIARIMESFRINGIDRYKCINNVLIKRDTDNIGYVKILDKVDVCMGINLISQFDRRCSGYINSVNLIDLGGNLDLSGINYDYINDRKSCLSDLGLLDVHFNDIKINLINRLNKNKVFSRKR